MARVIRAKAPLRVSFAGGGTDVPPFCEREGGLVLNATITRYAYGTLRPRDDGQISVQSVDLDMTHTYGPEDPLIFDGKLDLVKAAVRKLANRDTGGFNLFLQTGAPPGSGLGSSSTVLVALIGLLKEAEGLPLSLYEIAELAYTLERKDLGIRGGSQDQYAATFGGFNFIELEGERVVVNPLRIDADVVNELEHNMLLCFTGTTRQSDRIIEDQVARFEDHDERALTGLRRQKELAVEMKNALLEHRTDDFGALLSEAWEAKKQMSPRITNDAIDEVYAEARAHGALGGKITGAGGGGHMLLYCEAEKKHRVAEALAAMDVEVAEFSFDLEGLRTWRVGGRG
jgi:D-glycero-alpha-D-manno-heptose-7-phosphate kinase